MRKSYDDLKKKSDEDFDGCARADLRDLKLATFNHFLAKWETVNEDNEADDITALKNVVPVALRKHISKEIDANKNALK